MRSAPRGQQKTAWWWSTNRIQKNKDGCRLYGPPYTLLVNVATLLQAKSAFSTFFCVKKQGFNYKKKSQSTLKHHHPHIVVCAFSSPMYWRTPLLRLQGYDLPKLLFSGSCWDNEDKKIQNPYLKNRLRWVFSPWYVQQTHVIRFFISNLWPELCFTQDTPFLAAIFVESTWFGPYTCHCAPVPNVPAQRKQQQCPRFFMCLS